MLNLLIGPISQLAGTWLEGKVEKTKAETGAKVAKAKAEADKKRKAEEAKKKKAAAAKKKTTKAKKDSED